MSDLISVIVPVYNTEFYIEKTLQSIINQTYRDFEVIIIDDASTDKTSDIIESYIAKHHNINLIKFKSNQGVSVARNTGLRVANGKYITFVDSDDLLTRQALEIMYKAAKKNDADLVLGMYKTFSSEGTKLGTLYKGNKSLTTENRVYPFTNPEIFSHPYIFSKLYKKELIEGVFFPEGVTYAEDQPFTMLANIRAEKIYTSPFIVYYYREREKGESATQIALKNPDRNLESIFKSFEYGKNSFKEIYPEIDSYALLLYLSRVLEGSIKFMFEGAIKIRDHVTMESVLTLLIEWVQNLEDYLVLGTDSFQLVFLDNGKKYMEFLNAENQMLYIQLLKVIRDKKYLGDQNYKEKKYEKNKIIEEFINSIDRKLEENICTPGETYSYCYPVVSQLSEKNDKATLMFDLAKSDQHMPFSVEMNKDSANWKIKKIKQIYDFQEKEFVLKNTKPKILLTYRNFSGSNTLALFKSLPKYIHKEFDVDIIQGNITSLEYITKVMESDIIITTNMEYNFNKFHFNPNKLVIDLWHGFPLKNMFFSDPNYHDKNSISSHWSQVDYLMSYSTLYNEAVNQCIKVNPNNFFVSGAPRNDLLFSDSNRELLFDILNKRDIGQRIIFYMPTFRLSEQKNRVKNVSNMFGMKEFEIEEFIKFLKQNNMELIIHAHPVFGADYSSLLEKNECISLLKSTELMNKEIDLYELLSMADFLITDYSSVYFDYLLLDKPIIFTPTDLDEYTLQRGFVLGPYEEWTPGPKVINQNDLQYEILKFLKDKNYFKEERREISKKVHHYEDSNSSKRVWEFIYSLGLDKKVFK